MSAALARAMSRLDKAINEEISPRSMTAKEALSFLDELIENIQITRQGIQEGLNLARAQGECR